MIAANIFQDPDLLVGNQNNLRLYKINVLQTEEFKCNVAKKQKQAPQWLFNFKKICWEKRFKISMKSLYVNK